MDEKELPKVYHATFTREEIEYLTIGMIANASFIDSKVYLHRAWRESIAGWVLDKVLDGIIPRDVNNRLSDRFAQLLALEICPTCQHYHLEDSDAHR